MELLAILRTLRRHWVLILALTVVGGVVGAASAELSKKSNASKTFYRATNTMVVDLSSGSNQASRPFQSLDQVAIFTTTGDVPNAVAKKLGSDSSGQQLAEHIVTTTNGSTSTIAITAAEPTADEAVTVANTFADQLVVTLDKKGQDAFSSAVAKVQSRIDTLKSQIGPLVQQSAANPNDAQVSAQLQALQQQLGLAYSSYSALAAQGPPTSAFTPLQKAQAVPIDKTEYDSRLNLGATSRNNLSSDSGSGSSSSDAVVSSSSTSTLAGGPVSRGAIGAFLGLLLGVGLAFVMERLDRRVRTRAEAEAAFQLPVIAEVPQVKKSQQRDHEIVANSAPLSRYTEAFRAVRSSLLFTRAAMDGEHAAPHKAPNGVNGGPLGDTLFEPQHDEPLVVMVTSSAPGEGKTTTTANLAAVFAEAGSSVLVVNCDFRRPTIHRFFGVEDEPRRVHETSVPGVKIVTNVLTDPASNPSQVVAAQRQVVAAARGRFDVILLDTAPLLTANDAVELVSSADLLVLVARVGMTKSDNAERAIELLNRLDVALAGVVLTGVASASNDYYYYYQPGRLPAGAAPAKARTVGRTQPSNGNGKAAEADMFIPEGTQPD